MPQFTITVAYDGTDFNGWQRQPAGTSIQSVLEAALEELDGRQVAVTGAGRTDAGVHALAQAAAFSLERTIATDALVRAINVRLPDAVRVLSAAIVPDGFHPRFAATAKTYRYRIWNDAVLSPFERRYAWHIIDALDVTAMDAAAQRLVGTHDFAAFQGTGADTSTTVRTMTRSVVYRAAQNERGGWPLVQAATRQEPLIVFEIAGDGFLRHMVRNIAGSLVDIGRGRFPPAWLDEVLASRDRTRAGRTAPAQGLFLVGVQYE